MKTAISLPDELYEQVERWITHLGVNRSAFFARAAERYVRELEAESLTQQIDDALDRIGGDATMPDVLEYNRRRLAGEDEDW